MSSKSIWRAIHEALIADGHDEHLEPPTVEEMLAYRRGELNAEEEARVRERLVAFPELARAVAQPFPPDDAIAGDADYVPPDMLNRRWKALQQRIHGAPRRESGRMLRFWQMSTAVAATLALSFGVLLWKARSELGQPRVAWEEVTLLPNGSRGPADTLVTVEPNAESILLELSLFHEGRFAGYRLDIVDPTARRSLWSSAVTRRDNGNFAILVPRTFLRPGTYDIVLYGVEGRMIKPLTTYSMYVPRH